MRNGNSRSRMAQWGFVLLSIHPFNKLSMEPGCDFFQMGSECRYVPSSFNRP